MRCNASVILTAFMAAGLTAPVLGQPTTGPATAPATTQARREVLVPPGFVSMEIEGTRLLLEPADEPLVRAAIRESTPATMPSTRPADLLDRLAANRESLKTRMMTDLALTDPAPVEKFLDESLRKILVTHRDVRVTLVFLVISEERLKEILRGGWSDPRFYYNRVADRVQVNWNMNIPLDREPDDSLVPAVYNVTDTPEQRRKKITDALRGMEENLAGYLASHAADDCYNAFMDFALSQTIEPVKQKLDREWIASGFSGLLTCRYASIITGRNYDAMLRQISAERPDLGLPQSAIDLIHPMDPAQMRPGAAPMYFAVYTRKAIRVCNTLVTRAGDGVIPRILSEIRKNPPADGAALVEQIKQLTGIDLATEIR